MSKHATPSGRLIFGKPSLARVWCRKCREETLHRFGRCVHCNALHVNPQRNVEEALWRRRRAP